MKVKEERLREELGKAIRGEEPIAMCAKRLGISLQGFQYYLYRAREHGIEAVLHSNRPGGYAGDFKLEVVESILGGMTARRAARECNIAATNAGEWAKEYLAGGKGRLHPSGIWREGMGRKKKPRLEDFEVGSPEYYKLKSEMLERENLLLKKAIPLAREAIRARSRGKRGAGSSEG